MEQTIREVRISMETVETELDWDSEVKEKLNKNGFQERRRS